jgi:hypothetical protein
MDEDKGIIYNYIDSIMSKLFGKSWTTTFWGIIAILPQVMKPIQDYLVTMKVSESVLNLISLVAALIFAINTKSYNVTGGK